MLEITKYETDPGKRIKLCMYYLSRIHQDVDWVPGWELTLWELIHSANPETNICRCDLKDLRSLAAKYDLWMSDENTLVSLADWSVNI